MAYVIGGVILGVFVAVIVVLMKKDAKECSEMVEKLTEAQIPAVGEKPDPGYSAGSWDTKPTVDTTIAGSTNFTYTFACEYVARVGTDRAVNYVIDPKDPTSPSRLL